MRLIDADALVNKFWQDECRTQTRRDFVAMVNYAPTVDANPIVCGEWTQGDCYDYGDVCSVCDWDSERDNCKWSYCPNCGAKMK